MTTHSTQDYQGIRLHDTGRHPGSGPAASVVSKPLIVGIWRLVQKLHAGTWCDIFAAQPADAFGSPRFDYAVKIAHSTNRDQPETARQIRAEVEVLRVARHPHLIPILDADLQGTRPFIVMPRIAARTLADVIAKSTGQNSAHPIPVALWWIRQCAQALLAVHESGWIHGDVKPENILVDSRGHVTLIDLGFAQSVGSASDANFRGTPDYVAPERKDGVVTSPKSDIFSLGTVLDKLIPAKASCPNSIMQLIEQMRASSADKRPATRELCERLLKLEIENLHLHLNPNNIFPSKAA